MLPCKYYKTAAGCGRGDSCRYSHDTESTANTPLSMDSLDVNLGNESVSQLLRPQAKALIACKFFAKGRCQNGGYCEYSHEVQAAAAPRMPLSNVCSFLIMGKCTKGNICSFLHDLNEPESRLAQQLEGQDQITNTRQSNSFTGINTSSTTDCPLAPVVAKNFDNPLDDVLERMLSGALVIFGDGAKVNRVSFASDFTTIMITGLPQNTTIDFIKTMLAKIGFELPGVDILVANRGIPPYVSAYLRTTRDTSGQALSEQLESGWKDIKIYSQLKARPVPTFLFSSSDNSTVIREIDCRKVLCSWYPPSKLAFLNFGNKNIAEAVCNSFNAGRYEVMGKVLKCDKPTVSGKWNDRFNKFLCILRGVPPSARKEDIEKAMDREHRPNHLFVDKVTPEISEEFIYEHVKNLCSSIGPLESWDPIADAKAKRTKVRVRFQHESDARKAAVELNRRSIDILPKGKLMFQQMISAKIKVSTEIYMFVESQIEALKKSSAKQGIFVKRYPDANPAQRFSFLFIEGEFGDIFTRTKNMLEKMLRGDIAIADDGKPVWHDHFNKPAGLAKLKQVEKDHNVMIELNRMRRQLRFYGSSGDIERAQYRLLKMIRSGLEGYALKLNFENSSWKSSNGGLQQIASALDEDTTSVDTVSAPNRLLITGGTENYHKAMEMVKNKSISPRNINQDIGEGEDCVICWCPPENPIRLKCDHLYCLQCFQNMCFCGVSGDKETLITCKASGCNMVVSMGDMQHYLPLTAFGEVLEASLDSFVRRNLEELRYCPSPDCKSIYRVNNLPIRFRICHECLAETCTSCHASHTGMTCAEYKYEESGGDAALARLKAEQGYKDCPTCHITIEKIDGCNHIQCPACTTHICWHCLEVFSTDQECYEHMKEMHNGIYAGMGPDYEDLDMAQFDELLIVDQWEEAITDRPRRFPPDQGWMEREHGRWIIEDEEGDDLPRWNLPDA